MAHDCFYPALGLFLAMRVAYMTLVLLKTKEINKVHFEEKVLNHLLPKNKMIDGMLYLLIFEHKNAAKSVE